MMKNKIFNKTKMQKKRYIYIKEEKMIYIYRS
jgi:hypothetical protein